MFNIVFLFPILMLLLSSPLFLFLNTTDEFIVLGEILNEEEEEEAVIKIIEKNIVRNQQQSFKNTSFDIELSDLYYKNSDQINLDNNNFEFTSQPIVMININIFSCELEKIDSESICVSLSNCGYEDSCGMKVEEAISNLIIIGKEPIYSLVTSSQSGIYSKQVKLHPGEYEIFPNNNDVISSNYCNEIELDGLSFEEFTMGASIAQDNTSVMCVNISDGCYGTIKNGEIKVCEINKVFINK